MSKVIRITESELKNMVKDGVNECIKRSLLSEKSFRRVVDWITNHEIALVTAFRGKKENIKNPESVKDDGRETGSPYSHKENRVRNRELSASLLSLGYGVTKVGGTYIENFGMPNARHSNEESFLVVNLNNDPKFFDNIFKFSEYFNQDCFCYKAKDEDVAYNIGTNDSDYPGYGNKVRNGKFITGLKNEFMTRVGNKGFSFTDNDGLEPYKTSHADRKAERMEKRLEKALEESFDRFSNYGVMGKQSIKNLYRNLATEMAENTRTRLNEDETKHIIPTLPHTNNAFKVGEMVFIHLQKTVNGKVIWVDEPAEIIEVEPTKIRIRIGQKTYTIPKQLEKIKCTDTWRAIYNSLNNGESGLEADIQSGELKFDYKDVDGEDSVVVTMKRGMLNPITFRYRYDDVRNNLHNGVKLKAIPMKTETEEARTGLWLKEGDVTPIKSKNPVEGAVNVKRDWVVFKRTGSSFSGSVFEGWNIKFADELCSECPWLSTIPAFWISDPDGSRVKKKTTPDKF